MTDTVTSFGPSFGLGVLAPVTIATLAVALLAGRAMTGAAARFVLAALWLRYAAGAFHLVMFRPLIAGLSVNALASVGITLFGLAFVVNWRNLAMRPLLPVYLLMLLVIVSAFVNGEAAGAFTALTKYGYFVVILIATLQALRRDPAGRFPALLLAAFLPLLIFQALSVALNLPKGTELDGLVWIGGYNHEAAFSVALFAGFMVACFATTLHPAVRMLFLIAIATGITLAGYRTAILALAPLALATFWSDITLGVRRDQRALMATAALIVGLAAIALTALLYRERFADIAALLADPGALIKPPQEFSYAEAQLMSARPYIWSSFLYAWADGSATARLIGFGPESWTDLFKVYPHNTLVGTVYELGLLGVAGMLLLWFTMFAAAMRAPRGDRLKLGAAHLSFILLNMATMPFWQVEGLGLYGFLCGYTLYRARRRIGLAPSSIRKSPWAARNASTARRQPG